MWAMSTPSARPRIRTAEPSGFTLFLLFFGSLIAAGLIGIWLWNSNASVKTGSALGTPNQVGSGAPSAGGAPAGGGAGGADPALVEKGQQLATQFGCVACHSVTGAGGVGPTWKGLAGSQSELDNGQKVTADDNYLQESILQPDAKIVKGFPKGVMAGAVAAAETQLQQPDNLNALLAYIKSLK
jgi:cytochrome c551/c552